MKNEQSFEMKLEKAKKLLDKLSDPSISLEESVKYYKEGIEILKNASQILENAKQEFVEISKADSNEN